MIDRRRITGLVLAGGRGSRMGAVDKGLQPFRGEPLVVHALRRLAPQVGTIVVSANRNADRYAAFGHPVLADALSGHEGPLAGLARALAVCTTDHLAMVPCDAPFFPEDLVARLALAFDGADRPSVAVARAAGRLHPVFCAMRIDVLPSLTAYLAAGRRAALGWIEGLPFAAVDFADSDAFRNLNTPDELRDAERGP